MLSRLSILYEPCMLYATSIYIDLVSLVSFSSTRLHLSLSLISNLSFCLSSRLLPWFLILVSLSPILPPLCTSTSPVLWSLVPHLGWARPALWFWAAHLGGARSVLSVLPLAL